jgi:hypothetical protein
LKEEEGASGPSNLLKKEKKRKRRAREKSKNSNLKKNFADLAKFFINSLGEVEPAGLVEHTLYVDLVVHGYWVVALAALEHAAGVLLAA